MDEQQYTKQRLADRILYAFKLSLDQNDKKISELLAEALELAMTRQTKKPDFVERREYPEELENCMEILNEMRKEEEQGGGY